MTSPSGNSSAGADFLCVRKGGEGSLSAMQKDVGCAHSDKSMSYGISAAPAWNSKDRQGGSSMGNNEVFSDIFH